MASAIRSITDFGLSSSSFHVDTLVFLVCNCISYTGCGLSQGAHPRGNAHTETSIVQGVGPDQAILLAQDITVLCHGLGDHKNGFVLPQLAEALAKARLSSLRFDFPGNGESDGTFRYANMVDEVFNDPYSLSMYCSQSWHLCSADAIQGKQKRCQGAQGNSMKLP